MRRVSLKRRRALIHYDAFRAGLLAEVDRCEVTGKWVPTEIHHIGRGESRCTTLCERCAVLAVSREGHRIAESLAVEEQLAILLLRRPQDYDLSRFNSLVTGARRRTQGEVDGVLELVRERI